jgi:hypothetical protein
MDESQGIVIAEHLDNGILGAGVAWKVLGEDS